MAKTRIIDRSPLTPWFYTPPSLGVDIPHPAATNQTGGTITLPGGRGDDDKQVPFAFGLCEFAGSVRYAKVITDDLWIVRVLALGERSAPAWGGGAGGELDGIVKVQTASGDILADNDIYAAHFDYWFHSGTLSQAVDVNLHAADPTWTDTLVKTFPDGSQRAFGYVVERYRLVHMVWLEGGVPQWVYRFRGSKLPDHRTGTTGYSENPFVQWRFLETDPLGGGMPLDGLNVDAFDAAADIADQLRAGHKRYTCHWLLAVSDPDEFRKTFRILTDSYYTQVANQWTPICDRPGDPVATLTEADFVAGEAPEFGSTLEADQVVNHVVIEMTNTNGAIWKTETMELKSDALYAGQEDEVLATYKLPQIHDPVMGGSKLFYLLYSFQGDWHFKQAALASIGALSTGAIVALQHASTGIEDTFRLISREKRANTFLPDLLRIDSRKYTNLPVALGAPVIGPPVGNIGPVPIDVTISLEDGGLNDDISIPRGARFIEIAGTLLEPGTCLGGIDLPGVAVNDVVTLFNNTNITIYLLNASPGSAGDNRWSLQVDQYGLHPGTCLTFVYDDETTPSYRPCAGSLMSDLWNVGEDLASFAVDLAAKAPLNSPAFTGSPTAPTPAGGTNSTRLATTAFVRSEAPGLAPVQSVAGRFGAVTLAETDLSFSDLTTGNVGFGKHGFAPKTADAARLFLATQAVMVSGDHATPAFRAITSIDIPTLAQWQITDLVADLAARAPLASPALTGTPSAPTPTAGDSSTKIATTAFVAGMVGVRTPIAYNAGDFSSDVGSWTVDSGDVDDFSYKLVRDEMRVWLRVSTTSISGTPAILRVAVPAGKTVASGVLAHFPGRWHTAAAGSNGCDVIITGGNTYIAIYRDAAAAAWPNVTNGLIIGYCVSFAVA